MKRHPEVSNTEKLAGEEKTKTTCLAVKYDRIM